MPEPIIDFRGVTKRFGEHVVYERMSLSVLPGETLTIIGGSGGGKSVCLKMMIGLLVPDEGQVLFHGTSVPDMPEEGLRQVRRKVAYVFQGGALFDSMTVGENIGYALREHTDWSMARIEQRASECLTMVGLHEGVAEQMPASLSGGMKKRVALARSIAIEPEVILYDEPTTGLDPKNIKRIGDMILKLQRELDVTSVVVTHDMPTARKVSNRIAMLYQRAFPFVGTADEMWHSAAPEVRDFIHGRIRRAEQSAPAHPVDAAEDSRGA
ncbi:ABC transporter ATP-binding protein [Paraliomyxa miuraensis]|uniref:ABC transporter ATP-binding protein n=1 Tax=Paraliomyxa miuraensis TaxID=376150 RepID=UPI0022502513|nr:ATP-binding cassette domain-containing protein [Paraliomyxa miuraensis]MCX4244690.1 ATP-binding cassette domain-containing protein [Paraliomyxa miuraensis]